MTVEPRVLRNVEPVDEFLNTSRSVFDWKVEDSTDEADDLVKLTTTNERIISSIYRSTISGPVVHWKARRKAQLIPRAKLRAPLPNFQRIFSSAEKETDHHHESKKHAKKLEKRKKVIGAQPKMEPQMIRVKNSISPASHLHSEKIRISRDAAIFEIRRELPQDGAKFSSRYEIYNSTIKPFGKSYRELTLSSSGGSGVSSSESQTSTTSSSNSSLSETTTYITCSSEIEPVKMTGFQCIDEAMQHHTVSILNEERFDGIHEATNFALPQLQIHVECGKSSSDNESDPQYHSSTSYSSPTKQLVSIDTWSGTSRAEKPLKSPKLLREMITEYESGSRKTLTRCRSLLNLELKPVDHADEAGQTLTKTTSEFNLQDDDTPKLNEQEKERITKTISIMLERRRKQAQQDTVDHAANEAPSLNGLLNDKLVNDNIELIERRDTQTLDRSCRVTGEVLKANAPPRSTDYHRNACTLPRSMKSHRNQLQRHFYYPLHAAKSNNHILDEELPDPDKVKHARELFERVLKIGSLENVNSLPRSPQRENWGRPTPEIRQPLEHSVVHSKLHKCYSVDTHHKWSDNGSMSSGVGSDMSAETDDTTTTKSGASGSDSGSKEDVVFSSSEEDLAKDVEEFGKPISEEILNSIRAYGTSVTYYGGKIIASSKGYSCSPMTMTIMNEIKRSSPGYHANRRFLFEEKNLAKFKLIKSNSCGSRLELSGTDDCSSECESPRKLNGFKEDCNNNETRREPETIAEEEPEEDEHCRRVDQPGGGRRGVDVAGDAASKHVCVAKTWTHYEHVHEPVKPVCDMKFEEFEVLEETS